MSNHFKILVTVFLMAFASIGKGQVLTVDNNPPYNDPTYLVQSVLLNTGVFISNVTFNGSALPPAGANQDMIGYFQGAGSNLGISDGVLFNTGSIFDAPGPNNSTSDGVDNGTPGDPDLNTLASFVLPSPTPTFNAAVLEFDFYTVTDAIGFRYVFASEEYNEFVCTQYNDVFGFFISGPGITGPFSNNGKNIALVPGTGDYVAINSVNNGTPGSAGGIAANCGLTGLTNTSYFIDNEALGGQTVQYDGFTTVLTASTQLIPCETYHIKIAVADAGDGIYDSGLFLEAASFGAIGIQVGLGAVGTSVATLVEGCDSLKVIFTRAGAVTSPMTIVFTIGGTANNGIDYPFIADSITIPIDSSTYSFYLSALIDGLPEGLETIILTIPANLNNATCLDDIPSTATITIVNTDPLVLTTSNDTFACPGDVIPMSVSAAGGIPPYTYTWSSSPNISCTACQAPTATPNGPETFYVQVTDDCGTDILFDSVVVDQGGLTLTQNNNNMVSVEGCKQASFKFTRTGSTALPMTVYFTVGGTATNGVDYLFITDSVIIPAGQSSVEIFVTPIVDGLIEPNESIVITTVPDTTAACAGSADSIIVFIQNVDPLALTASNDTTICGGQSATVNVVTVSGGVLPYIWTWHDGTDTIGTDTTTILNIAPDINTTYTVVVADTCGNPIATDTINVFVSTPPPSIRSVQDTAYEGCRDAMFTIIREDTTTNEIVIYFTISGSATNITDYIQVWDSVIIAAGDTSADINIYALIDGITEGDETLVIELPRDPNDVLCYAVPFKDSIIIKSVEPMTVDAQDKTICPGSSTPLLATSTGGIGPVTYLWNNSL
ncbi:MAG: choice-of-anchor L domain-containing protein [Flavobacteriales bacterium]|nr:choice-of-anchor L domain-containing protein [Flavobacteriales bacterium]